jgi:hypothetical protein
MVLRPAVPRLVGAVLCFQAVFFGISLAGHPKVTSDAAAGLLVWHSMERGGRWNRETFPDPDDIAKDRQEFTTWWSPGQYLAVGPLHSLGLSWGHAISVATFALSVAGLVGFFRLYTYLGFSEETAAWAVAALSLSWHVTLNYGEFTGGELPAFAAAPWILLGIFRLRPLSFGSVVPFAALYLLGTLVKLSFAVTAVSVLAAIWLQECWSAPSAGRRIRLTFIAALMAAVAHIALWAIFLRLGANPSTAGDGHPPIAYTIFALLSLPLGSVLGLSSILSRIFLYPGHELIAGPSSLAPMLAVAAVGLMALGWAEFRNARLPKGYAPLVGTTVILSPLVLGALIFKGSSISLEDRHVFAIGALALPALIELARAGRSKAWSFVARAVVGSSCAYGLLGIAVHYNELRAMGNVGRSGITQHVISPPALRALEEIDDASASDERRVLLYVPSPEIAFEMNHVRVFATFDHSLSADMISSRVFHGRVPLLVVASDPELEEGGKTRAVLRSFVDYPQGEWKRREVGGWTLFFQGTWPDGKVDSRNPQDG